MNKRLIYQILFGLGLLIAGGFCLVIVLITTGSGLTMWYVRAEEGRQPTAAPVTTLRPLAFTQATTLPSPTPSLEILPLVDTSTPAPPATATATLTATPTLSETTTVEATATATPAPAEPVQPVEAPPPADTPAPTATPAPDFNFTVVENQNFPTGNPGFDVFIAITNADNKPLPGYRVIGRHSSGLQVESSASAGDWTENSGAMHYKAGNIKYSVPNSPGGVWTLQLVDESGQPAAAPLEIPFDEFDPTWHFVLFREVGG